MIKKREKPNIMDMVEQSLLDVASIKDISVTLDKFYKLKYSAPRDYTKKDVQRLRKKFRISQAVLAHLLNTKLTTVQKWESGVNTPSGPANRLLQILELQGPKVFVAR